MSGYLDVKCPVRASRGLCIFKAWKKQWCILRPHPTEKDTSVLALHSSVDVLANSTIELPAGSTVCRTKSRTHEFAFGVFLTGVFRKPRVLLAGQTESETQSWMAKIRAMLNGETRFRKNIILSNSFEVSVIDNEFSRQCLLYGVHGTLTISSHGILISQANDHLKIFIAWKHFTGINLVRSSNIPDKNKICQLEMNSGFDGGAGRLSLFCAAGGQLVEAVREGQTAGRARNPHKRMSRSESDLYNGSTSSSADEVDTVGVRRSSCYSGPSDVSLDDTDLVMTKDAKLVPTGMLSRCAAADDLYPLSGSKQHLLSYVHKFSQTYADNMSPMRRSCLSLASGIYEEILEDINPNMPTKGDTSNVEIETRKEQRKIDPIHLGLSLDLEENTYESVADCVYGTMRRTGKRFQPPPLPPRVSNRRTPHSTTKVADPWSMNETDEVDSSFRHGSLGSLPRCLTEPTARYTKTLPKPGKNKPFSNVFRKRIKSESRSSSKQDKSEPKKKKFDFGGEMIKNLSVSRVLLKNLRISTPTLKLGEARSCEYLEEAAIVEPRCSKSEETLGVIDSLDRLDGLDRLDDPDEGQDLSAVYSDTEFSLPRDIVELILRGRDDLADLRLRQKQLSESDYIAMSPSTAVPPPSPRPPPEGHYIIMTSPQTAPPPVTDVAT